MKEEEEEKKKNELLAQMHLRIFCLGIRQMDSTKRILLNKYTIDTKKIFHTCMFSDLLKIVPGAMKKFDEIIAPKEELLKEKNLKQKMDLFFEAVSEVRSKMCEKQEENKKNEGPNKTVSQHEKHEGPNKTISP